MNEQSIQTTSSNHAIHWPVRFVPLGISKVSDSEACVGAIAEDGSWVRPEIPTLAEVKTDDSPFIYFQWAHAVLGKSLEVDPRPEDHHMIQRARAEGKMVREDWEPFINTHLDASVEAAFAGVRSLGLVKVLVHRFYRKQSTGGRFFIRVAFEDQAGEAYDWIISEVRFPEEIAYYLVNGDLTPEFADRLVTVFQNANVYFTIALTKPNNRFPGKFRGCHPVIIGVHSLPDYVLTLSTQPNSGLVTDIPASRPGISTDGNPGATDH